MADWDAIKKEYVKSDKSFIELAKEFGVPHGSLRNRASKEKWKELRDKRVTKKAKRIVTAVTTATAKEVKKESDIQLSADGLIRKIKAYADSEDFISPTNLQKLTQALKDLKDIKHDLTAYELREQDARIRALEKQSEEEKKDTEMTIQFVNMEWDKEGDTNSHTETSSSK